MPQRGQTPGTSERTSGSIGHTQLPGAEGLIPRRCCPRELTRPNSRPTQVCRQARRSSLGFVYLGFCYSHFLLHRARWLRKRLVRRSPEMLRRLFRIIARAAIVQAKPLHFQMLTYEETWPWAAAMKEAVRLRKMPPFSNEITQIVCSALSKWRVFSNLARLTRSYHFREGEQRRGARLCSQALKNK